MAEELDPPTVHARAVLPEGGLAGPERYIYCDFCGYEGAPLLPGPAFDAETAKHGKGVCG